MLMTVTILSCFFFICDFSEERTSGVYVALRFVVKWCVYLLDKVVKPLETASHGSPSEHMMVDDSHEFRAFGCAFDFPKYQKSI